MSFYGPNPYMKRHDWTLRSPDNEVTLILPAEAAQIRKRRRKRLLRDAVLSAFFFGAALLVAVSGSGCRTPQPRQDVQWPRYVACAPAVDVLVGTVSRLLMERNGSGLEDLARAEGPSTVACLVQRLVEDWTAPGAAQVPERVAAVDFGKRFLDERSVKAEVQR